MNPNDTTLKTCRNCLVQFPNTTEYFRKDAKYKKDGLNTICKSCHQLKTHESMSKRPRIVLDPTALVECVRCKQYLPVTAYHRDKWQPNGLQIYCKECHKPFSQNWIDSNREYYLDQKRAWRKANPDKVREQKNASQKRHRSAANARSKRWRENNHETMMMFVHRRIALRNSVPEDYTVDDWQYALDYFNHSCAVCGRSAGFWHTIAKDHWIPLKADNCPGTIPSNIIPLCHVTKDGEGACNNSKGKKDAEQWLSEHYTPKQVKTILARIDAYFATVRK